MSKLGSHEPFGYMKHKSWPKEGAEVKLQIWLPTTKSRKSTQFRHVQMACNIPLESFQQGLQLCLKPHYNRRFSHKVMGPQNRRNASCGNSWTPTWESQDKMPFRCGLSGEA
jgi:hypothetical protein